MADEILECDIGDVVELHGICLTKITRGSIDKDSSALVVESTDGYANGDSVLVTRAGVLGSDLEATIASIAGNTLNLSKQAAETVTRTKVARLTNPTTHVCRVKKPDGSTSTVASTNPTAGRLRAVFSPTAAGEHKWSFKTTGAAEARGEQRLVVREQDVPD
jgi:hypothetical protein